METPKALKPGDTIGIAAPSSPFDRNRFLKGVHLIERMGFRVHHRSDIFDQNRYLAGTDERRAGEFTELVLDRKVAAIMFARGGYGSQRIIPLLDPEVLILHRKPVVGFSDVTALLTFLRQRCGFPTFYGPVVTQLGQMRDGTTSEALFRALTTAGPLGQLPAAGATVVRPGSAKGPLVGGCLSLVNSSMGTPYELSTEGAILFLEEIHEKVYVLDRMLTQLKNSGMLSKAAGIVLGSIAPPEDEPHDVEQMVRDVLGNIPQPVIAHFPAGHVGPFVTLPLGATALLTAEEGKPPELALLDGALA